MACYFSLHRNFGDPASLGATSFSWKFAGKSSVDQDFHFLNPFLIWSIAFARQLQIVMDGKPRICCIGAAISLSTGHGQLIHN